MSVLVSPLVTPNASATEGWFGDDSGTNIDAYGRPVPNPVTFPSSANGAGFGPLASQLSAMGVKLGAWFIGGIPREAVEADTPIKGTSYTARDLFINTTGGYYCPWKMSYGYPINHTHPAA